MGREAPASYVSTAEVARALGVSVSTVKRWVDDRVLPAHKTAGGHRRLLVADVLELARRGDLPQADLAKLSRRPSGDRHRDAAKIADELHRSLVAGNAVEVRSLILGGYDRGMSIEDLADRIIAPAMERLGQDWERGRIDVMEEHRGSQLCAGALFELKAILEERAGRHRPRAVGGAAEQDQSLLPSLLAQMVLLDAGWEAVNLGPSTPFRSFAQAIRDLRPQILCLSVCHLVAEEEFIRGVRELYKHAERAGVPLAVGGRALVEGVRSKIPYTTHGDGLSHLAAFARTLHPRPQRPRRGRPRRL
jgi:MerR family transcriptional regulator, light-induced transcriptional regulator